MRVVKRSSCISTGISSPRRSDSSRANARVSRVCSVSEPSSDSGSPTTTRSTSRSRTSSRSRAKPRLVPGRATTSIGVTIVPDGSLSAQPQRALP